MSAAENAELMGDLPMGIHPMELDLSLLSPPSPTPAETVKPKRGTAKPTLIDGSNLIDAETYGGKAHGLSLLIQKGMPVPRAMVLQCAETFRRPFVDKQTLRYVFGSHQLISVRSGAPVSMPGMLDTVFTSTDDSLAISRATRKVWDSWGSARAVAYRAEHGIPDNLGTGVIYQKVPSEIRYSGVAFTADPEQPDTASEYQPQIEYVNGLGESLVSGRETPIVGLPDHPSSATLSAHLHSIHEMLGASDVEWVMTEDRLWFLQWRKLKFNPKQAEPIVLPFEDARQAFAQGRVLAAPQKVTGTLTMVGSKDNVVVGAPPPEKGDLVWAASFKPEHYSTLLKAAGILVAAGGKLCHAAIVAREMNKPAVGGIGSYQISPFLGQKVTLWPDGILTQATPEEIAAAEQALALPAVRPTIRQPEHRIPRKIWEKRQPSTFLSSQRMLVGFYTRWFDYTEGRLSESEWLPLAAEWADQLNAYFYWASLAEARHGRSHSIEPGSLYESLDHLGIHLSAGYTRSGLVSSTSAPPTLASAIRTMELVTEIFGLEGWGNAYGGKPWRSISSTVLSYLRGDLSDTLFVDACFNLRHNNGSAFNKFGWMATNRTDMDTLLNARRSLSPADFQALPLVKKYQSKDKPTGWVTRPMLHLGEKANSPDV